MWYNMISCEYVWCDIIWFHVDMYDVIWYDMIWYDRIYDMIGYGRIWQDMIWYDRIWYDVLWCAWAAWYVHAFMHAYGSAHRMDPSHAAHHTQHADHTTAQHASHMHPYLLWSHPQWTHWTYAHQDRVPLRFIPIVGVSLSVSSWLGDHPSAHRACCHTLVLARIALTTQG